VVVVAKPTSSRLAFDGVLDCVELLGEVETETPLVEHDRNATSRFWRERPNHQRGMKSGQYGRRVSSFRSSYIGHLVTVGALLNDNCHPRSASRKFPIDLMRNSLGMPFLTFGPHPT
jgi:hypothetical protein